MCSDAARAAKRAATVVPKLQGPAQREESSLRSDRGVHFRLCSTFSFGLRVTYHSGGRDVSGAEKATCSLFDDVFIYILYTNTLRLPNDFLTNNMAA